MRSNTRCRVSEQNPSIVGKVADSSPVIVPKAVYDRVIDPILSLSDRDFSIFRTVWAVG